MILWNAVEKYYIADHLPIACCCVSIHTILLLHNSKLILKPLLFFNNIDNNNQSKHEILYKLSERENKTERISQQFFYCQPHFKRVIAS